MTIEVAGAQLLISASLSCYSTFTTSANKDPTTQAVLESRIRAWDPAPTHSILKATSNIGLSVLQFPISQTGIIQWRDLGSSVTAENVRTETSLTPRTTSDLRNPGTCCPQAVNITLRETAFEKKARKHCALLAPLILSPVTGSSGPFKICESWNIMGPQQ